MKNILKKINDLLLISRPISWVNTAYPFAAGYLLTGGTADIKFAIGTFFFFIPYNLMMYGVNDVFDYESDIRNPRKGGIEGAVAKKAFHPTIIKTVVFTNLPFIVALMLLGNALSSLTLLVLTFFVIAYSAPKLRFKERPILDSITSSIHFVGPLIFALTLTNNWSNAGIYVLAFFLWGVASQAFGAVQDIVPDREAGLGSVATVLGAKNTVIMSALLYLLSSLLIAFQGGNAILVALAGLLYYVSISEFLNLTDANSARSRAGWKRFMWLNYFTGFVVTVVLILAAL